METPWFDSSTRHAARVRGRCSALALVVVALVLVFSGDAAWARDGESVGDRSAANYGGRFGTGHALGGGTRIDRDYGRFDNSEDPGEHGDRPRFSFLPEFYYPYDYDRDDAAPPGRSYDAYCDSGSYVRPYDCY